jgi:hypothetical protein
MTKISKPQVTINNSQYHNDSLNPVGFYDMYKSNNYACITWVELNRILILNLSIIKLKNGESIYEYTCNFKKHHPDLSNNVLSSCKPKTYPIRNQLQDIYLYIDNILSDKSLQKMKVNCIRTFAI